MMKKTVLAIVMAAAAGASMAQTNVGVSVQVAQPGLYGRIDIGQVAQPPAVVYQQPVLIAAPPRTVVVEQQPIYLRVPPGHRKHWAKHCREYNACGQRVYFVREDWYQDHYVPAVRAHEHEHEHGRGDDDRGHGHGKGKGHGRD